MKVIQKGLVEYLPTFEAMKAFNAARTAETEDELWVVEHPPVFTQGLAGKPEHLLIRDDIPVVQIDRGGQITYHGPGQLVVYTMIDFKRRKTSVRRIVSALENSIISTLSEYGIKVNMDLSPFTHINPCGYAGMEMVQIADFVRPCPSLAEVAGKLTGHLQRELNFQAMAGDEKNGKAV